MTTSTDPTQEIPAIPAETTCRNAAYTGHPCGQTAVAGLAVQLGDKTHRITSNLDVCATHLSALLVHTDVPSNDAVHIINKVAYHLALAILEEQKQQPEPERTAP